MAYKQVLIVRTDLDMKKGKIAAQVAHAAVGLVRKSTKYSLSSWEKDGSKKVVLKVNNLRKLKNVQKNAMENNLPTYLVADAGLTQLRPGTVTCLGIGPAEEKDIDHITKNLKLL